MLDALITSKTRLKLLLKFFLNGSNRSYLRGLETEFGESSNAIRIELNRFEEAGLLISSTEGNRKIYRANQANSIYHDINNLLRKFVGIDEIIEKVVKRVGSLHSAYITGDVARGIDSKTIDLVLVGQQWNEDYVNHLASKVESLIKRQIQIFFVNSATLNDFLSANRCLLIWQSEA